MSLLLPRFHEPHRPMSQQIARRTFLENSVTTDQTTQPEQPPVVVQADATERLAQLHASYDEARAAYDEANSRLEAIKAGIKAELAALAPEGADKVTLTGPDGPPLGLTYSETWRFDSRRFKREDPETYVRYAKKSGSWTLRALNGGE